MLQQGEVKTISSSQWVTQPSLIATWDWLMRNALEDKAYPAVRKHEVNLKRFFGLIYYKLLKVLSLWIC